jgi:hypothetical protein
MWGVWGEARVCWAFPLPTPRPTCLPGVGRWGDRETSDVRLACDAVQPQACPCIAAPPRTAAPVTGPRTTAAPAATAPSLASPCLLDPRRSLLQPLRRAPSPTSLARAIPGTRPRTPCAVCPAPRACNCARPGWRFRRPSPTVGEPATHTRLRRRRDDRSAQQGPDRVAGLDRGGHFGAGRKPSAGPFHPPHLRPGQDVPLRSGGRARLGRLDAPASGVLRRGSAERTRPPPSGGLARGPQRRFRLRLRKPRTSGRGIATSFRARLLHHAGVSCPARGAGQLERRGGAHRHGALRGAARGARGRVAGQEHLFWLHGLPGRAPFSVVPPERRAPHSFRPPPPMPEGDAPPRKRRPRSGTRPGEARIP